MLTSCSDRIEELMDAANGDAFDALSALVGEMANIGSAFAGLFKKTHKRLSRDQLLRLERDLDSIRSGITWAAVACGTAKETRKCRN